VGCSGDGYTFTSPSGTVYNESNTTGTENLNDANGCPYVVTVDLTFNSLTADINEVYVGCSGDGYTFTSPSGTGYTFTSPSGTVYSESNTSGTENLNDANGCPYMVIVNLTYAPLGCTDMLYCEFDPSAVCDDNTCQVLLSNDNDCDGVAANEDCDDNDPLNLFNLLFDGDCDGVLTIDDCDDNDNSVGSDVCGTCTIICPNDISISTDIDACTSNIVFDLSTDSDCFGTLTFTQLTGLPSGSDYPTGLTTNTYMVVDQAGYGSTCSFDIYVFDTQESTINCPDDQIVYTSGACNIDLPDYTNLLTGFDNCSNIVSVTQSPLPLTSLDSDFSTPITLSAIFDDGTISDCTFNVSVEFDNVSLPQAICENVSVMLDPNGLASITESMIDNGSTGTCGLAFNLSQNDFECNDIGDNTVELLIEDGNGNQSTCQSIVTVIDNTAPEAICQDITVALDQFGDASILPEDINAGSNDACGFELLFVDNCAFSCNDVGNTIQANLFMRDFIGNQSTCVSNVTIIDPLNSCNGALCGDGIQNGSELGVDCGGPFCGPCGTCPLQLHYDNTVLFDGTDETANHRITTSGTVETNGDVILKAKDYIELTGEFTIPANSNVELNIQECNP